MLQNYENPGRKVWHIHVDGACRGNPGPGGYGGLATTGTEAFEFSGSEKQTTNNRMELMAAIVALSKLREPGEVHIYTDSQYVQKGMTEWLPKWQANGWKTSNGKTVENKGLWIALGTQARRHAVKWHWVRGHNGDRGNERADQLARGAIKQRFAMRGKSGVVSVGQPAMGDHEQFEQKLF